MNRVDDWSARSLLDMGYKPTTEDVLQWLREKDYYVTVVDDFTGGKHTYTCGVTNFTEHTGNCVTKRALTIGSYNSREEAEQQGIALALVWMYEF